MIRIFAHILIVSVLTLVIAACGSKVESTEHGDSGSQQQSDMTQDTPTPKLQFAAYSASGKVKQSSEWIGKQPVVLNFWGTWCPPCRKEIPDLVKLYAEYKPKGVEIIGLAVNDPPDKVTRFANTHGMGWVMLLADRDVATACDALRGVPTTIFIDRNGNEVKRFVGAPSYEQFRQAFEAII